MTAELNEALATLGRLYEAKAGLVERKIAIFEEVQRVGIVAPGVPVMVETICATIDELDVLILEVEQLLGTGPRGALN
jgi:hypothetical protein